MRIWLRLALVAIASLLTAWAVGAGAAEFQLNPLRLVLTPAHAIDAFRLNNPDDQPVRIQLTVKAWSQGPDGEEYADTHDLISNPPMFEVQPKGSQTVRLGLRDVKQGDVERAYRAFFQEVPAQDAGQQGIHTLLRISVPVFVPPTVARPASLGFTKGSGHAITIHNNGNVHVQITKLTIEDRSGHSLSKSLSLYVLAGQSMAWTPEDPSKLDGGIWKITAETDNGSLQGQTDAAPVGNATSR
jgi:fimbrial chaperone protein